MKRALMAVAAALVVIGSGCQHHNLARNSGGCRNCGHQHGAYAGMHGAPEEAASGPPSAAVAYPYYTNRGPRDFLQNNPPNIGR